MIFMTAIWQAFQDNGDQNTIKTTSKENWGPQTSLVESCMDIGSIRILERVQCWIQPFPFYSQPI
jgi:hypothetical protein